MKKTEWYGQNIYAYPIEKAREILQEDGTILTQDELQQIVSVLTLLAEIEKQIISTEPQRN